MTAARLLSLPVAALLSACASLPPGSDFAKPGSTAFDQPGTTLRGRSFEAGSSRHPGVSGFRLLAAGVDGFLARAQLVNRAERSLDIQYFILRDDETGQLLVDAVLRAADRGVRVRVLVDDAEAEAGDEKIAALAAHPNIQVRIFNPFAYRGLDTGLRALEYMASHSRLDYRMHNKLLVVDGAIALIGGRNIADAYFQIDPDSQFADHDVFVACPIVENLAATFDEFWNSRLSIPAQALTPADAAPQGLAALRRSLADHRGAAQANALGYARRIATGEPLAGIVSGSLPLVWAHAQVVCDSPDKRQVEEGEMIGRLMHRPVAWAIADVKSELLMITPYLVPGHGGMLLLDGLRERGVSVRILTSSLEASTVPLAQSGYMHYRVPLIESGVELHEIRSLLGNTKGSGETRAIARFGNYSLHAKLFVLDRQRLFIGSMNFDQRSLHLNTEIGLIIDSPELAQQIAERFDAIVQPANAYLLSLQPPAASGLPRHLVWSTSEQGRAVDYEQEPARSAWHRAKIELLSLLPMDKEL